jgi:DNA-binding CsgD family transcriptional regulator
MPTAEQIDLDLLERIYDVPLQACDWAEVVARLRERFCADAGTLVVYGPRPQEVEKICLSGHDDAIWRDYAARFAAIDPFYAAMRDGRMRPGRVTSDSRVLPHWRSEAAEYFNDFWRRHRLGYSAGGHAVDVGGNWIQMALPRPLGAPDYSERELAEFQYYFNHVNRALQLERAIAKHDRGPDLDHFATHYGLTLAETGVLGALIECGTLPRAAARLQRSHNTLRAHLRAILTKTSTRSQVELITLVHSPPAAGDERSLRPERDRHRLQRV